MKIELLGDVLHVLRVASFLSAIAATEPRGHLSADNTRSATAVEPDSRFAGPGRGVRCGGPSDNPAALLLSSS